MPDVSLENQKDMLLKMIMKKKKERIFTVNFLALMIQFISCQVSGVQV